MPTWNNSVPSKDVLQDSKREALLRAAASAFNRQGFHGTSLDDLARSLGVTKAALYHYFPNKHSVLHACFQKAMDVATSSLAHARATGSSGREKLQLCLAGYLEAMIDELSCCVVLLEENALLPDDHASLVRQRDKFERALRDLVREGIADGSIVPCDPKFVVFTLLGALNWVPKWFRSDGDWTAAQLTRAYTELIERMLSTRPTARLTEDLRTIGNRDAKPERKGAARPTDGKRAGLRQVRGGSG